MAIYSENPYPSGPLKREQTLREEVMEDLRKRLRRQFAERARWERKLEMLPQAKQNADALDRLVATADAVPDEVMAAFEALPHDPEIWNPMVCEPTAFNTATDFVQYYVEWALAEQEQRQAEAEDPVRHLAKIRAEAAARDKAKLLTDEPEPSDSGATITVSYDH
jgi:hypothetical protein